LSTPELLGDELDVLGPEEGVVLVLVVWMLVDVSDRVAPPIRCWKNWRMLRTVLPWSNDATLRLCKERRPPGETI